MDKSACKFCKERGNVTIIALMILMVLTLIGISASRISNTDILAARNHIPFKKDFYIAEGGQNKEAIRIGRGDCPVTDTEAMEEILDASTGEIAPGSSYDYEISFKGSFPPPAGYSILHFKRFDYGVTTKIRKSGLTIKARYFTIKTRIE